MPSWDWGVSNERSLANIHPRGKRTTISGNNMHMHMHMCMHMHMSHVTCHMCMHMGMDMCM